MLTNAPLAPTVPVVDLDRATKFYSETLGLKPCGETVQGKIFEAGNGTQVILYQREKTKADHTVFGFDVEDLEKEVQDLKGKGVIFEEYDTPQIKTVNSIAVMGKNKVAWFKDTEDNIIAIGQMELIE
jgi:predicted enzyme related to lactoylglutathione lyase